MTPKNSKPMASNARANTSVDIIVLSSDDELNGRPMPSNEIADKKTVNVFIKSISDEVPSTSSADMTMMGPSTSTPMSAVYDGDGKPPSPSSSLQPSKRLHDADQLVESIKQRNGNREEGNRMSRKRYGRILKEVEQFLEEWKTENPPDRDSAFHYLVRLDGLEDKFQLAFRLLRMNFGSNPVTTAKLETMASIERKQYVATMVNQVKQRLSSQNTPCEVSDLVVEGYLAVLDGVVPERVEMAATLLRSNSIFGDTATYADLRNEVEEVFSRASMRTKCTESVVRKFLMILRREDKRSVAAADLLEVVSMAVAEHELAGSGKGAKPSPRNNHDVEHDDKVNADAAAAEKVVQIHEWVTNGEYDELQQALLKDADTIVDIFPHVDRQEAYAYLEMHVDRPDRVYAVIEELMYNAPHVNNAAAGDLVSPVAQDQLAAAAAAAVPLVIDQKPQQSTVLSTEPGNKRTAKVENVAAVPADVPEKKVKIEDALADVTVAGPSREQGPSSQLQDLDAPDESDEDEDGGVNDGNGNVEQPPVSCALDERLEVLRSVFPTADPDFLHELIVSCDGDDECLRSRVDQLVESKTYPLLKDRLERENMEKMRTDYSTRYFTPSEILEWNVDPLKYFYDTSRVVSRRYKDLAHRELVNQFPKVREQYLRSLLRNHNFHFIPCLRILMALDWTTSSIHCKKIRGKRLSTLELEPDETFYKELAFSRVEQEFRDYLKKMETEKAEKMKAARAAKTLVTCNCCFDDEILAEDTVLCDSDLHRYCRECVRRGMEVAIGQTKTELKCMTDGCDAKFSMATLKSVLSTNVFANLVRRIEAAEIEEAQIDDLEKCPHCSFAAIMPDHYDKVFRCLNPECMKETCRLCKEPSHIPLRCNEIERESEVRMRTYIENKMSEALMRQCPNCQRKFTKEFGCNLMTCLCGSKMCYVCRQPIKDYNHFGPGKCPQESNLEELHNENITQGATEAKQEFVTQNPDLQNLALKHDPLKDLPKVVSAAAVSTTTQQQPPNPATMDAMLLEHLLRLRLPMMQHAADELAVARGVQERRRERHATMARRAFEGEAHRWELELPRLLAEVAATAAAATAAAATAAAAPPAVRAETLAVIPHHRQHQREPAGAAADHRPAATGAEALRHRPTMAAAAAATSAARYRAAAAEVLKEATAARAKFRLLRPDLFPSVPAVTVVRPAAARAPPKIPVRPIVQKSIAPKPIVPKTTSGPGAAQSSMYTAIVTTTAPGAGTRNQSQNQAVMPRIGPAAYTELPSERPNPPSAAFNNVAATFTQIRPTVPAVANADQAVGVADHHSLGQIEYRPRLRNVMALRDSFDKHTTNQR